MRRLLLRAAIVGCVVLVPTLSRAQLDPPAAKPATGASDTGFTAGWSTVSGANAYFLDVSTSRTFSKFLPSYSGATVQDTSAVIAGLNPGIAYYYRVRSTNLSTKNVSANSDTITAITLPGFPLPIPGGAVGGNIVYSRQGNPNDTIWIAAGDGSFDTMVVQGAWPRLSHNGRYLAFHRGSDANKTRQNLLVRDLQSDSETVIYYNNDYLVNFCWTPNDSTLFFDFSCSMYYWHLHAPSSGGYFSSDCYDDGPSARGDSGAIAFHNYYNGIMLVDAGAANRRVVPNTAPHDYWPTWSPDGQWLSFGRPAISSDYPNVVNYYKIRPDGTGLTQLTFLSGADTNKFMPTGEWTSDGKFIVAPGYLDGVHGIFAIPTDGSGIVRELTISKGAPPDFVGTVTPGGTSLDVRETETTPRSYELKQNYPNPFNPSTDIRYHIADSRLVNLTVYDILGRAVATLVDGVVEAGTHTVTWNASGHSSGVYFYRLTAGTFVQLRKMILLK